MNSLQIVGPSFSCDPARLCAPWVGGVQQTEEGVIQVIEKTPMEVAGERIVRPLIDTTSSVALWVLGVGQNFVSRINLLPVVAAAVILQDNQERTRCEEMFHTLDTQNNLAIQNRDPYGLKAVQILVPTMHAACMEEINRGNLLPYFEQYQAEKREAQRALERCTSEMGDHQCYLISSNEMPTAEAETIDLGYYGWTVYVNKWFHPDWVYARGGYNWDFINEKANRHIIIHELGDVCGKLQHGESSSPVVEIMDPD